MQTSIKRALGAIAILLVPALASAAPFTFSWSSGTRAASVTFDTSGTNLVVTLTNTSTFDAMNPTDILTAVFFDVAGSPTLTPLSAALGSGSTVFFGPNGGGNMGGEWAYGSGLSGAPGGAATGISSAGFGLFGNPNFGGPNLQGPTAVNGIGYGITSAGDNSATGNAAVTGQFALIQNSVVFTLSGLPGGFDPSTAISNVVFQYGTSLSEPSSKIPEPATVILLGPAALGLLIARRRVCRRKGSEKASS